jgi:CBS domain-containing protein
MLLKELCTPDVVYCAPETRILAAARLMRERHVGDLVVVDDPEGDQTPIGMVTDRDIVVEVLGRDRDPATVTVREIMRTPAVIASETEESATAIARMRQHGVRRMPVMGANRRLAGIVCLDDLLKHVAADVNALVDIVVREQGYEHRTRR